jgi:serine/threonine protein phosphatase PrpC
MPGMEALSPALDVTSAFITAIGGRRANEDALGKLTTRYGTCYVISDGAGGHVGGAIASRLVIDTVLDEVQRADSYSADVLDRGFALAQRRVAERQDAAGRHAVWAHLGDSRIFHFRRGALRTVTHDHSLVQRLVDAGYVPADLAASHPNRNLLYAALGAEGDTPPSIEREPIVLGDGDAFLLCTDGFWGRIEIERIEQHLRFAGHVDEWVDSMRRDVAEDIPSGADNYSAIGIWIGSPAEVTVSKFVREFPKQDDSAER